MFEVKETKKAEFSDGENVTKTAFIINKKTKNKKIPKASASKNNSPLGNYQAKDETQAKQMDEKTLRTSFLVDDNEQYRSYGSGEKFIEKSELNTPQNDSAKASDISERKHKIGYAQKNFVSDKKEQDRTTNRETFTYNERTNVTYRIKTVEHIDYDENRRKEIAQKLKINNAYKDAYKAKKQKQLTYNRREDFKYQGNIEDKEYVYLSDVYKKDSTNRTYYGNINRNNDTEKHSSVSFTTANENKNYKFVEKKADAHNTFQSEQTKSSFDATSVAGSAASAVAAQTSSDQEEARKKQAYIEAGIAAAKIAASAGADTGEALASYAKGAAKRQGDSYKNASLSNMGNSSGVIIVVIAVLLAVVVSIVPVLEVIYPFYYVVETVSGWINEIGEWFSEKIEGLGLKQSTKDEMKDSPFNDTIAHYYTIMNDIVSETNSGLAYMFGDEAASKQQQLLSVNVNETEYNKAMMQYYEDMRYYWNIGVKRGEPMPDEPDVMDYSTPKEDYEIVIFEGYYWSEETEGTSVPYGQLYDEVLCSIAAYNASMMTDGIPQVNYKMQVNPITGEEEMVMEEDADGNEKPIIESVTYLPPPDEPVLFKDDTVKNSYNSLPFWKVTEEEDMTYCGGCTQKPTFTTVTDEDGTVRTVATTVSYCPGHLKIYVTLNFDWDINAFQSNFHAGSGFGELYDMIYQQYQQDKATP